MAGYFAELKDNIVQRVISSETKEWCETTLGGEWVQTYYATEGKNYAGIGYKYVPEADNFCSPQPYPSWTMGDDCKWYAPTPQPTDGQFYVWNEENLVWDLINA
jgi:hypothetical protein